MSQPSTDAPRRTENNDGEKDEKPYIILALQGGGALGAFQAGAYQALSEYKLEPDWVTGISIGAINAAIIAGNKQADRLDRLKEFWSLVAGDLDWWERIPNYSEKLTNFWRVGLSMGGGVSGFFRPNYIPGPLADPNSPEAASLYNTQRLKINLERLANFDHINKYEVNEPEAIRLSLGVTRVFGGESRRFQNFKGPNTDNDPDDWPTKISADHVMASGALAPWFPGISLKDPSGNFRDKQLYWDGGITSNSSFKHIIELLASTDPKIEQRDVLVFVIDLWGAYEREPKTFDEVCWRVKQVQYSSRLEQDIKYAREYISYQRLKKLERVRADRRERAKPLAEDARGVVNQLAKSNAKGLAAKEAAGLLPKATKVLKELIALTTGQPSEAKRIDIIRISYRSQPNEIPSGDALFSRTEIDRRFRDGYAATRYRLEMKPPLWERDFSGAESREETQIAVHLF